MLDTSYITYYGRQYQANTKGRKMTIPQPKFSMWQPVSIKREQRLFIIVGMYWHEARQHWHYYIKREPNAQLQREYPECLLARFVADREEMKNCYLKAVS